MNSRCKASLEPDADNNERLTPIMTLSNRYPKENTEIYQKAVLRLGNLARVRAAIQFSRTFKSGRTTAKAERRFTKIIVAPDECVSREEGKRCRSVSDARLNSRVLLPQSVFAIGLLGFATSSVS